MHQNNFEIIRLIIVFFKTDVIAYKLVQSAIVKLNQRDYQGALDNLNKADKIKPNDALTLRKRGEVNRMLGDYCRALDDLNKADQLRPNNEKHNKESRSDEASPWPLSPSTGRFTKS